MIPLGQLPAQALAESHRGLFSCRPISHDRSNGLGVAGMAPDPWVVVNLGPFRFESRKPCCYSVGASSNSGACGSQCGKLGGKCGDLPLASVHTFA